MQRSDYKVFLLSILVLLTSWGCGGSDGGVPCSFDSECPAGSLCVDGTCQASGADVVGPGTCQTDGDCGASEECLEGRCVGPELCRTDADCVTVSGGRCLGGMCDYLPGRCASDADCPTGYCDLSETVCREVAACSGGCSDGDPCTDDGCDVDGCWHAPVDDCCQTPGDCDDANPCTADDCVESRCSHTPTGDSSCCAVNADCDDGDPTTVDRCTDNTCRHLLPCTMDGECVDADPCTFDACVSGGCENVSLEDCCRADGECDDGDICTTDSCSDGVCQHDEVVGCCRADTDCDDGDVCTDDSCSAAGECLATPVTNCCGTVADCDDDNVCTTDSCVASRCQHQGVAGCCATAADCNDGDACTTDRCLDGECQHLPAPGCCDIDADCDDDNLCTTETCDPDGNCQYEETPGCCRSVDDCDDANLCTTDICTDNECDHLAVEDCCRTASDCPDQPCHTAACTDDTCSYEAIVDCCVDDGDCDDSDVCTVDACGVDGTCVSVASPGCCRNAGECDDENVCTADTCEQNACVHSPVPNCCNGPSECPGQPCTTVDCVANVCTYTAIVGCCAEDADCDDGNELTVDVCDEQQICQHTEFCEADADCDDGFECTADSCNLTSNACSHQPQLIDACLCRLESECAPFGATCTLVSLAGDETGVYCRNPHGSLPMGSVCDPAASSECRSGLCLTFTGGPVCFGACGSDGDCAENTTCGEIVYGGQPFDPPLQACVPPRISCVDDSDCPNDRFCMPYVDSNTPDQVSYGCVFLEGTLARVGEACTVDADCESDFCLDDATRGGICFGPCDGAEDCRGGQRCYPERLSMTLDLGTPDPGDDVRVDIPSCRWDDGTFDPCTLEDDCGYAELCYPFVNDTDDGWDPRCIYPLNPGGIAPGSACFDDADCQSEVCISGAFSDICMQMCDTASDCPSGLLLVTCDPITFLIDEGDPANPADDVTLDLDLCVD